ncbi:MAG: hypothetical protein ACYC3H_01440 [Bellilinea sp.]
MATNFPLSLDSFSTKIDNLTDVMAADVNNLQDSVLAIETLLGGPPLGWLPIPGTVTYVSATSFTISGDLTAIFKLGVKVKLVNSTTKYGYVLSSSYSAPNTTVNLVPNASYSLAAGTITDLKVSYTNPPDFPSALTWTPTFTGFSVDPVMICRFSITDRICTAIAGSAGAVGTSNATTFTLTPPVNPAAANPVVYFPCRVQDNGINLSTPGMVRAISGGTIQLFKDFTGGGFTASGNKTAWFTVYYEV